MPTGPELNDDYKYRNFRMALMGLATEVGSGTASSKAVTINDYFGVITSEALTTAQNAVDIITMTNSRVAVGDVVLVTLHNGTNTQGTPMLGQVKVTANTVVITFINKHASAEALNGTLLFSFMVVKAL